MGKRSADKLIFYFCVNERSGDRRCCAADGGNALRKHAKERVESYGCKAKVKKADCLGYCSRGPVVEVEPGKVFYRIRSEADVDAMLEAHLKGDGIAKRLLIGKKKS